MSSQRVLPGQHETVFIRATVNSHGPTEKLEVASETP